MVQSVPPSGAAPKRRLVVPGSTGRARTSRGTNAVLDRLLQSITLMMHGTPARILAQHLGRNLRLNGSPLCAPRPSADGGAPIARPVLFAAADYRLALAKFLANHQLSLVISFPKLCKTP